MPPDAPAASIIAAMSTSSPLIIASAYLACAIVALISASFDAANSSNCSRYCAGQYSRSCESFGPMWVSEDTRTRLSTPGAAPGFECKVATIWFPPW